MAKSKSKKSESSSKIDLDLQVNAALKLPEVRDAYKAFTGKPEEFISGLRDYIAQENYNSKNLLRLGTYLDYANRKLVPLDMTLDAFAIFAGVGTAAKGIVTLAKLPAYLAYNAYYLGKTGDLTGTLGNAAYELGSWFLPGSLPHLIERYKKQAEKYAISSGSKKFLGRVKNTSRSLEDKLINFPSTDDSALAAA